MEAFRASSKAILTYGVGNRSDFHINHSVSLAGPERRNAANVLPRRSTINDSIMAMHNAGASVSDIVRKLGVTRIKVRYVIGGKKRGK